VPLPFSAALDDDPAASAERVQRHLPLLVAGSFPQCEPALEGDLGTFTQVQLVKPQLGGRRRGQHSSFARKDDIYASAEFRYAQAHVSARWGAQHALYAF
jgi:hypothetical protein